MVPESLRDAFSDVLASLLPKVVVSDFIELEGILRGFGRAFEEQEFVLAFRILLELLRVESGKRPL